MSIDKDKIKFNKEQEKAITYGNGPLLIVAGAGTGKTMVITQRIAHLILDKGVNTDGILALTFTEKAAEEMEERVDRLLPYGYVDLWISTFHSFCQKILQQHALDIGLPNDFKVLSDTAQWLLVRNNLEKFNLDYYKPVGNPTKFIHAMIRHFSRAKDEMVYPDEYLQYAEKLQQDADSVTSDSLLGEEALRIKEVSEAYHVYQQLLADNDYLDFGDLINSTIKLFEKRKNILAKYQKQFDYVLLDEFQDTNYAQYELIKLLAGDKKNLTVVGDDDQSIYKFRGASVSNILQFKDDFFKSQEIVLTTNYRSKQDILDLSYNFIQLNNPNRLEYQLNNKNKKKESINLKSEIDKRLKANEKGPAIIEHIHEKSLDLEIEAIIRKMVEIKKKDKEIVWNDFAILVRANESATPFINYLRRTNIPYQFLALRGLYGKPAILDIMAYFKLLDNYHESPAVFRILCSPTVNIEQEDIIRICHQANKQTQSIYEVLKNISLMKSLASETISEINSLVAMIEKHTQLVKEKTVGEILRAFLEDSQYLEKLLKKDEYQSNQSISYINQFYKRIKQFEEEFNDASLKLFMQEMELELESGEKGGLSLDLEAGPDMVKLMTIHAAKGLEYKYVFIPNMVDRRFPTTERKDPILLPDALVKEILPEGDIHLQEERRLFYVAITRAKIGLFLTSADDYGGARKKKLSRFLQELTETNDNFKFDKRASLKSDLSLPEVEKEKKRKSLAYDLPKRFSYSQLAAYKKCPYQYKLSFIVKVPIFGKGVFSYGKSIHKVLEEFYKLVLSKQGSAQTDLFDNKKTKKPADKKIGELVSFKELLGLFEKHWIDEWYETKEQREKYYKQAQKSLKQFYQQVKDQIFITDSLEKPFNLKIKDFTVRGVIDRVDRLPDGSINIVDYKTGKAKEKLSSEDKMQLLIYQIAAEDVLKEKVNQLVYYYFDDNSSLEFIGQPKDTEKIKQDIIKEIKDIETSKFMATPSMHICKFCDFRNICEFKV